MKSHTRRSIKQCVIWFVKKRNRMTNKRRRDLNIASEMQTKQYGRRTIKPDTSKMLSNVVEGPSHIIQRNRRTINNFVEGPSNQGLRCIKSRYTMRSKGYEPSNSNYH